MSEPAQKCENNAAIFEQIYTIKMLNAFKWPISALSA